MSATNLSAGAQTGAVGADGDASPNARGCRRSRRRAAFEFLLASVLTRAGAALVRENEEDIFEIYNDIVVGGGGST